MISLDTNRNGTGPVTVTRSPSSHDGVHEGGALEGQRDCKVRLSLTGDHGRPELRLPCSVGEEESLLFPAGSSSWSDKQVNTRQVSTRK